MCCRSRIDGAGELSAEIEDSADDKHGAGKDSAKVDDSAGEKMVQEKIVQ